MTPRHWLIAAVVCIILEIIPPATHFFFLCLSLGALAAAIISVYSPIVWLPWVVFVVGSIALMPMMIPLAKFLFAKAPSEPKE